MSDGDYHHSPELLKLLTEAIWRLTKSKEELLDFFWGSGTESALLAKYVSLLQLNASAFKKPIVTRELMQALNAGGDKYLGVRRRILQRVVEWEDFSTCWDTQRDEAELNVTRVRALVNRSDSFTRSQEELERERSKHREIQRAEQEKRERQQRERETIQRQLADLANFDDPAARGHEFESALNSLFEHAGIQVRDSFHIVRDGVIHEQIDGVVSVDSAIYLVEVKWHNDKLGPDIVAQHMMRLLARSNALGLYISKSGFTRPGVAAIEETLNLRTTICADWHEILFTLEKNYSLRDWIKEKTVAAVANKNIYHRFGVDFGI